VEGWLVGAATSTTGSNIVGRAVSKITHVANKIIVAFDIVGQLTLSRRLGFLKEGRDVGGVLNELHNEMEYRGTVQNMPWIDKLIRKNPIYLYFRQPTSFFAANSRKLVGERLADEKHTGIDMLDGFLEAQKKYPDLVDQPTLAMYISTNFLAGSDTTSVTMRTIIYHVLRTPSVLETLRKELDANITTYPPDYNTAMSLTYLDAIIREALRIHPIGSLVFERKVPASGHITEASGRQLPPGAVIAQTPWTLNFDEDLWGPEPYAFRPERWLKYEDESVEAAEKRIYHMKHHDFSFSYGPRGCLGKHIAWMEMVEVMPTLFGLLDVSSQSLE
jgi:cytochrome P450